MEAFSTQGNGTMTIVKEKGPTSFEVEQNLDTKNGARTIALDGKTGHIFTMADERGPAPPPLPARHAGRPRRTRAGDSGLVHDPDDRQVTPSAALGILCAEKLEGLMRGHFAGLLRRAPTSPRPAG